MKKYTLMMVMAVMALFSFTLTSCDNDADIAYNLEGTWKGEMRTDYNECLYSVIQFKNNTGYYSGTGYWVDYYRGRTIANDIEWAVSDGRIKIHLLNEDSWVVISDYSLTDNDFYGYADSYQGGSAQFDLKRMYNWRYDYNSVNQDAGKDTIPSRAAGKQDTITVKH